MALLAEYAITPDVFDVSSYSSEEVCSARLELLREVFLNEGLLRDLRGGEWSLLFAGSGRAWHARATQMVRKLGSQRRLIKRASGLPQLPVTDAEWCEEALASHAQINLTGIIASDTVASAHEEQTVVAAVSRLPSASWWARRSSSVHLNRNLVEYGAALDLVLQHANSIMLIDPHFDPSQSRYQDAVTLLAVAGSRSPRPLVEIHRVAWLGDGRDKRSRVADVEALLRGPLKAAAAGSGLTFEVFLWDDFHDRYLISDLVGISAPNGFDTTTASGFTTWTRLGRPDRDHVQREFDPASSTRLRHRFRIEPQ